jgi:uncharacterized protein YcgI (DUF1989 family)
MTSPGTRPGVVDGVRRVPRPEFNWLDYEPIAHEPRGAPVSTTEIAVDSGRAVHVPQGHVFRLACPDGAQVADVCFFNANDPTERLWANQTLNREGAYVSAGSRLWGTMPRFRPLATIVTDTVHDRVAAGDTPHHIVLGAHCNRWMWLLATGRADHPNCYDHLTMAVDEAGIPRSLIHDNVNFFQKTRLNPESHQYETRPSNVQPGDYVELYAELPLVVAISACPMGSGRYRAESGQRDPKRLLAIVYRTTLRTPEFAYPRPASTGPRRADAGGGRWSGEE